MELLDSFGYWTPTVAAPTSVASLHSHPCINTHLV